MIQDDPHQSPRQLSISSKVIKTVLFSIFLTLVTNTFLSQGLFIQSLNSIIYFQSTSTPFTILFFNLISFLANTIFLSLLISSLFMAHPIRIRVLIFLTFFILNTYLMTILKAAYHQARPFWYSKDIQQLEWTCPREYGNPSGHSWLVVVLYEPLLNDFWGRQSMVGKLWRCVVMVGLFVLVPFSRMYLGAHSGNQVFFGVLMGVSMVTLYRFSIQKLLYQMYQHFITIAKPNSNHFLKTFFIIIATQVTLIIIPMLIYINAPTQDFQYILILNQKCPDRITTSIGLNGGILFTSMLISFLFGLIYGLIWSEQHTLYYLYGQWKFGGKLGKEWKQRIVKVLVEGGLLMIPMGLIFVMKEMVEGVVMQYYVFSGVITLSGYLFMRYSDVVLVKMGVVKIEKKIDGLLW